MAVAVSVPPRVAPPGLISSPTVTVPSNELSTLPDLSSAVTVKPKPVPAVMLPGGWVVTATWLVAWTSKAPMSTVPLTITREARTTLIGGQGQSCRGIDCQGDAAGVDGRAARQQGDGLGRSAIVLRVRSGRGPGSGDADLVAVDAVDQAAGCRRSRLG